MRESETNDDEPVFDMGASLLWADVVKTECGRVNINYKDIRLGNIKRLPDNNLRKLRRKGVVLGGRNLL